MKMPEYQMIEPSDVYGPDPEDKSTQNSFEEIKAQGGFSDDADE